MLLWSVLRGEGFEIVLKLFSDFVSGLFVGGCFNDK